MHRVLTAVVLLLAGCSCGARSGGSGTAEGVPPEGEPTTPEASAGNYEVHEWGLVRAGIGDVLLVGAIGPPRQIQVMAVDKPVLYFHADEAMRIARVDVTTPGGAIVEAWPSPPRTGDASRLGWRDVTIDEAGAPCEPSPLPGTSDSACTSLPAGELCEVASLATVRVPDAACVRTAGATERMLFYRARTRELEVPLRIVRRAGSAGVIDVTNAGGAPIPGWLVRLHDDGFSVRALAVRPPAAGQTVSVGSDYGAAAHASDVLPAVDDMPVQPGSPEPGRRAVHETLHELGLTDAEADAFFRAWDSPIFGLTPTPAADRRGTADRSGASDESTADGEPAPRESVIYFLPERDCDRIAHVELDPRPRAFRRAFAVWTRIPD